MMTSEFNAIDYTNELQSTGVPKEQAAAHANALIRVLADVAFARDLVKLENNLRKEIRECEERMILRIDLVRTHIEAKIDAVTAALEARLTKLEADIAVIRVEIGSIRNEMVIHRWVLGLVLALLTANLGLTVKLVLP